MRKLQYGAERCASLPKRGLAAPATKERTADEKPTAASLRFSETRPQYQQFRLPCNHDNFHQKCIKNWVKRNPRCPMCNYELY